MGNNTIPSIEGHQINVEDLERILGGNISYENIVENFNISKLKGKIAANNIIVWGKLNGNIKISDTLTIHEQGIVLGKIAIVE